MARDGGHQIGGDVQHVLDLRQRASKGDGQLGRLGPDVPALKPLGLQEFDSSTYVGLMVPAAVPEPVIDTLAFAMKKALLDPQMIATLKEVGCFIYDGDGREFQRLLEIEHKLTIRLAQQGRLKSE